MDKKPPLNIAHRGGRKWAPENTLVAFQKSIDIGVDGIELDVQRCASGEIIVIHDADVNRTTNGVGLLKDITYPELKRLSAGSWYDEKYKSERLPLLSEVLELVDGKAVINVEIKNAPISYPGIEDDVIELLKPYKHKDKIIISSFDHKVLRSLAEKHTGYKLALLADALFLDLKEYAHRCGCTYWHPCFGDLTAEAVEEAHQIGLPVNAWTLSTEREWMHAKNIGVDGIVTDDPLGLKEWLGKFASAPQAC